MLWNYNATVTRVVDGDTLDVRVDLGFKISFETRLRLLGIDTWEVRGDERERGLLAAQAVVDLLSQTHNQVRVETIKDRQGKYGRYLARVWVGSVNLNQWLVDNGHTKS